MVVYTTNKQHCLPIWLPTEENCKNISKTFRFGVNEEGRSDHNPRKDESASFSFAPMPKEDLLRIFGSRLEQSRRHTCPLQEGASRQRSNVHPRKDVNATFDNAFVERELPCKQALSHKAGVIPEALMSIARKDNVRKKMRNFKPRKDAKAAFLKRLRRKKTLKKLSHKAGDCVEAHTSSAKLCK